MKRHNIAWDGYETIAFPKGIYGEDTLILTMQESQKNKICSEFPEFRDVYTLAEYVGDKEEIPSVYGQTEEQYEYMYELLLSYAIRVAQKLNDEAKNN